MSKFLRVDFEIQPWGCARVDGTDMNASLSVHEVSSLDGGMGNVVAISHVWGVVQCKVENVQGVSHDIKISSAKKMQRLLSIAKSEGWKNLWLDNICINQEDKVMKSREVMRMGDVYRESKATLILLDSTCSQLLREIVPIILLYKGRTDLRLLDEIESLFDMEWLVGKLVELVADNWYERVWTVQESALPGRIYMAPIDEDVSYDVSGFKDCRVFWKEMITFAYIFESDIDIFARNKRWQNIVTLGNRWFYCPGPETTMFEALRCTMFMKCTVPKDRVYGILGLVPAAKITPVYDDTPVEKVAITVMEECVNNLKQMDLLFLKGPKLKGLGKSMVPTWESLVDAYCRERFEDAVHVGNCTYDEKVGLVVSNPRIFEAKIVAVIEPEEKMGDSFQALFKTLKEKLHDDQLVELIRGTMFGNFYPRYWDECTAWEYFNEWAEIVSSPTNTEAQHVVEQNPEFGYPWRAICGPMTERTYIFGISKDNNCPHPCCERTYILSAHSNELFEDDLIVVDYGGHIKRGYQDITRDKDDRVPLILAEPIHEGVKFISIIISDIDILHEFTALKMDAITII